MDTKEKKNSICNFKPLPNFRVVHENIENPVLYRSSRPDFLEGDALQDFNALGIKMILDFRSPSSYRKVEAPKKIDKFYAPFAVVLPKKRQFQPGETVMCKALDKKDFMPSNGEVPGNNLGVPRKHLLADFMNPEAMMHFLRKLPWYLFIYAFLLMLYDILFRTGFRNFILFISKRILNNIGPAEVLCVTIDCNDNLLCAVLKLLTYKDNVPALINCNHGKDRSGIVSALVLWILGEPEDVILHDYGLSKEGLAPMRERLYKEVVVDYGLDPVFCEADPGIMKTILDHLKTKHGSIEAYLDSIGFGPDDRTKLRENFGVKEG